MPQPSPLPDSRDSHLLEQARQILIAASRALGAVRSQCQSWESSTTLSDLATSLDLACEDIESCADRIFDEEEEIQARREEARRSGPFRYARA
jgi:hypothetical protein